MCELEAKYKFNTDIFLLGEHTDWALQSFSLRQAICAIFQFIWMDAQRTRRRFAFFSHTQRERQSEGVLHAMQNWRATCKRYSLLYFLVKVTEFLWNSLAFKNCRVLR